MIEISRRDGAQCGTQVKEAKHGRSTKKARHAAERSAVVPCSALFSTRQCGHAVQSARSLLQTQATEIVEFAGAAEATKTTESAESTESTEATALVVLGRLIDEGNDFVIVKVPRSAEDVSLARTVV